MDSSLSQLTLRTYREVDSPLILNSSSINSAPTGSDGEFTLESVEPITLSVNNRLPKELRADLYLQDVVEEVRHVGVIDDLLKCKYNELVKL